MAAGKDKWEYVRKNLVPTEVSAGVGGDAPGDRAQIPQDYGESGCAPAAHGRSWWSRNPPGPKSS